MRTASIIALVALLLPHALRAQQTPASPRRVTLVGLVLDSLTGHPVRGATVSLHASRRVVFSDSSGRFSADALETPAEQIQVRQIGSATVSVQEAIRADAAPLLIRLAPDPVPLEEITARASRRGRYTIEGTVVDSTTGRPVPRVVVWFRTSGGNAITDTLGHYLYDGARAGFEDMVVDVLGYHRRTAFVRVSEPWQRIDFALGPDPVVLKGVIALARSLREVSVHEQAFRYSFSERELAGSNVETVQDFLRWAQAHQAPGPSGGFCAHDANIIYPPRSGPPGSPRAAPWPDPGMVPIAPYPSLVIINGKAPLTFSDAEKLPVAPSDFYQAVFIRDIRCTSPIRTLFIYSKSYLRRALAGGRVVKPIPADSLEALLQAVDTLR